jgi:hypothetical protein
MELQLPSGHTVLFDDADADLVLQYKWYVEHDGMRDYARESGKVRVFMHSLILALQAPYFPDHINGNGLDNRRCNLRPATKAENARNKPSQRGSSSHFKGVGWHRHKHKWQSRIQVAGKLIHLGAFVVEEDAARAYDVAADKYFGEFARLNFPKEVCCG